MAEQKSGKKRSNSYGKNKAITKSPNYPVSPIDAVLQRLDQKAYEMEYKWGTGVLHSLADEDIVSKWLGIKDKLDMAISVADYDEVKKYSSWLIIGWDKLEESVISKGHKHDYVDQCWFVSCPDKELKLDYIICKSSLDAARLAAIYSSKASSIYTLECVAKLIHAGSLVNNRNNLENDDKLALIMASANSQKEKTEELLNDEIPF